MEMPKIKRTRLALVGHPPTDQVGPIMRENSLAKISTIKDFALGRVVDVQRSDMTNSITLYWDEDQYRNTCKIAVEESVIQCLYCGRTKEGLYVTWCSHLQWAAKRREDWPLFTVHPDGENIFLLPLVPTHGIFVPISIREVGGAPSKRHLREISINLMSNVTVGRPDVSNFVIGYACGQFGMLELRSMAVDFLEGQLSNTELFFDLKGTDKKYITSVATNEAKLPEFTRKFYRAATGKALSIWEHENQRNMDAPNF